MNKQRAVFIDRDGVINEMVDRGENHLDIGKSIRFTSPFTFEEFILKPGVEDALKRLGNSQYLKIVVTNQPDLAYGYLLPEEHNKILSKLRSLAIDDIFVCPHGRNDGCTCRKPKPGMLLDAAKKWNIDLPTSYMIGDRETDMMAGRAVGCKTILIKSSETENDFDKNQTDYIVENFSQAVDTIMNQTKALRYDRQDSNR